ncbi:hypothetical protein VF14_18025 [Nostoc linckia z18]|uniref:Helicase HerA central domain-containing protein n=3 Tax=Nostoc linckia TaxID=92942 RepID=A0A9Q5ZBL5_NOSLI|nr:DUF87 domain-containing protein [Nostoc linckia]PHJ71270.1 hypothetical protein VF03_20560 [Nostoc linckia z2]PHJ80029.1 hypothetical protein VF06_23975 [Nostoc linckia z4]PHK11662.1 hypothetical protein VF09_06565 [Nostoc linckia z9]PHK41232.1 hypothetical protein VF12_07575 [Nostoc linckia z15]PHK45196.1 hypothetical protein VF13_17525 [Nostoc linckia z16]
MLNMSLGSQIINEELLIRSLLSDATLVGGIYTMGYNECLVLTNDLWKKQAGGIPQHCFLLATALTPNEALDADDEEIILLRVVNPAPLPAESELVQVRSEAMRTMIETSGSTTAATTPAILDVLTRNEIQFSALKAKVLGTFYDLEVGPKTILEFGSDIETFYSSSRYKVYKPYGQSLAIITSYPEITQAEELERQNTNTSPRRIQIGTVRYSSTNRRSRMNAGRPQDVAVPVRVNVKDFVALKTAVFGMTRLGKSNTMKTIATAVCQYAAETGQTIGQLLFDPAGEYANVNVQDRTALSQIGHEFVTVFRYGINSVEPGIRPLASNFYSNDTIDVTWAIITAYLNPRSQTSNYIRSFLSADVIGPADQQTDRGAYQRARRRRAALYATLAKANFLVPDNFNITIAVNASILAQINQSLPSDIAQLKTVSNGILTLNKQNLVSFWQAFLAAHSTAIDNAKNTAKAANKKNPTPTQDELRAAKEASDIENLFSDWLDAELEAILALFKGSVGTGFRLLEPLRVYHSLVSTSDYAEAVLQELVQGKIVIIDLSLGSETILKFCSERIINYIVQDASRRFSAGDEPHQIQIYIEEAHRLFNRDRMNVPEEADPYVRLAKEAAKYKIGLIYATQEVSSVDPFILSNTSNWLVTHLNNHAEVKELSKYYDFQDFSDLTLKSEDVGFARIKTRSGRYIIPTQIDLFDEAKILAARAACLSNLAIKSLNTSTPEP